jgi:2-alkyl-3-oxoalkanoate reductase
MWLGDIKAMRILITGATGFIGGRLVEALKKDASFKIRTTGRNLRKGQALEALETHFIACDLQDQKKALDLTKNIDTVIHCAGRAGTWGSSDEYHRSNVLVTENVLKAARSNGVKRFIHLSSPSVYFEYKDQWKLRESDLPDQFSSAYAESKYKAEQLVQFFHSPELETVSLRPRFVIGAGDNTVLPRIIEAQRKGLLHQIGEGKNCVDVTTVTNLVDAIMLCLHAPSRAMGEVYNITNGEPVNFYQLIDHLLDQVGLGKTRKKVPRGLAMALARLNEWRSQLLNRIDEPNLLPITVGVASQSMTLDIDKARNRLGYVPSHTTEEGVSEFAKWWKNRFPGELRT